MEYDSLKLILASASPRRRELIKGCFLNYAVESADINEDIPFNKPKDLVENLALAKARAVLKKHINEKVLVLGSDTIVVLGDKVLGKPKDRSEARAMLLELSGNEHFVLTGVALVHQNKEVVFHERTKVRFAKITEDLLELYLDTNESLDKAGSYGIQGQALSFIESVEGSYSNVVGLPVNLVLDEIKKFIGAGSDQKGDWRELFI